MADKSRNKGKGTVTGRKNAARPAAAKKAAGQKRRKRRRIKVAILALEFVMLAILSFGFYVLGKWDQIQHVQLKKEDVVLNTDMDESYVEEISKGYTNIGIFGVDGEGYNCDVIMICSINEDTGEIKLVSVYRDTILRMEDGSYNKANSAISDGNYGTSQMNVLNLNLDLNLDQYVVVDWTAVALAIDCLGGVEANITDAMWTEINGYITDTVLHLKDGLGGYQLTGPGQQHLSGVQAVAYCRLRHQDSDLGRTQRQREVIEQLFQKAKAADIGTLIGMIDLVFPYVTTTMELNDVIDLASKIGNYHMGETKGFPFYQQSIETWRKKGDWPMFALNLENNVSQLHEFLFGTTGYVPSVTVQSISQILEVECGLPTPETTPFASE